MEAYELLEGPETTETYEEYEARIQATREEYKKRIREYDARHEQYLKNRKYAKI